MIFIGNILKDSILYIARLYYFPQLFTAFPVGGLAFLALACPCTLLWLM